MRRTALIVLGVAGALVALVLIGVAIALATFDVDRLKGPLTARLSAATGRAVTIGGPLALDLSLTPTLRADDVTVANASWGSTPAMLHAQRMEAQVALLPLLRRQFEIVRVALVAPQITLETNRQGVGNWELAGAGGATGAPGTSGAAGTAGTAVPPAPANPPATPPEAAALAAPAIGIRELEIRNGTLRYRDGASGAVTPVQVDTLIVRSRDSDAPITGEFQGSVAGVPLSLRANVGSLALLRAQRWPYPVEVDGSVAGQSARLQAKATPEGKALRLDGLALSFGALSAAGTLTVDRSGPRPRYVVDLTLPRFAPDALALAAGAVPASAPAAKAPPKGAASEAIPLAALRSADAEGRVRIGELPLAHGQTLTGLAVAFSLRDGRLALSRVDGTLLGGTLAARGTVDASGAGAVDLHAEARGLDLARLLALVGSPRPVSGGKTQLTVDARATGASLPAWRASMDGNLLLLVGPAQLRSVSGNQSKLDELGVALNPFRNVRDTTELRCAVVRLPVRNGVAHVDRSIAFETAELGATASGTIDFREQTLDLAVHPQLRQGISLDVAGLADAVRLRGPFDAPQVSIDPAKSATALARIGAAIGTGGWSLLGETLINSGGATDSPCAVAQTGAPAATRASGGRGASPGRDEARRQAPEPKLPAELDKALRGLLRR